MKHDAPLNSMETMGHFETQAAVQMLRNEDIDLAIVKDKKRIFVSTFRMRQFFKHIDDLGVNRPNRIDSRWLIQSMVRLNFKVANFERIDNELWVNTFPKDSVINKILHAKRPLKIIEFARSHAGQMTLGLLGILCIDLAVGLEWMTQETQGFDLAVILVLICAGFSYHHACKILSKIWAVFIALIGFLSYLGVLWWKGIIQV